MIVNLVSNSYPMKHGLMIGFTTLVDKSESL